MLREALEGWQTTHSISTPKRGEPQPAKMPNVAWHVAFGALKKRGAGRAAASQYA